MASKPKKILIKLVIIGHSGVGKTSIMKRYVSDKFSKPYKSTIGADFLVKDLQIDTHQVVLQLWDTAGQERFSSLGTAFFRGADGFILVYDTTREEETLRDIEQQIQEALNAVKYPLTENDLALPVNQESMPFLLLGNKIDLLQNPAMDVVFSGRDRKHGLMLLVIGYCRNMEKECSLVIPFEIATLCETYCGSMYHGERVAEEYGLVFYPVSAKTNVNVETAFMDIVQRALVNVLEDEKNRPEIPLLPLIDYSDEKKYVGCACDLV